MASPSFLKANLEALHTVYVWLQSTAKKLHGTPLKYRGSKQKNKHFPQDRK